MRWSGIWAMTALIRLSPHIDPTVLGSNNIEFVVVVVVAAGGGGGGGGGYTAAVLIGRRRGKMERRTSHSVVWLNRADECHNRPI